VTPEEIDRVGQALLSEVVELSIPTIRRVVAAAGLDATTIPAASEARTGMGSRAEVVPAVYAAWARLDVAAKARSLPIFAERIVTEKPAQAKPLRTLLEQHGFRYDRGAFILMNPVDERERAFLPASSYEEAVKAVGRLSDGDESGALTSACGAVDSLMQRLYEKHGWGAPPDAFQAKVNTALKRLQVFESFHAELVGIGMKPGDATAIVDNLHEATKRATDGLQVLRRAMGDLHGTKPALRKTIYDALKWSSAISGLFEGYD
jgi:hypothetical protein